MYFHNRADPEREIEDDSLNRESIGMNKNETAYLRSEVQHNEAIILLGYTSLENCFTES